MKKRGESFFTLYLVEFCWTGVRSSNVRMNLQPAKECGRVREGAVQQSWWRSLALMFHLARGSACPPPIGQLLSDNIVGDYVQSPRAAAVGGSINATTAAAEWDHICTKAPPPPIQLCLEEGQREKEAFRFCCCRSNWSLSPPSPSQRVKLVWMIFLFPKC